MAEIRITADMQEAVRAQQQLADAATKGAKSAADAVAKVGDAWTTAGAKSSRVLKEQEAMVARMVMRVDQAASVSRRSDFEQRKMEPFHQSAQSTDARTTAANLDLAKRRHQGDISAALGEATIDAAKNERMPFGPSGNGPLLDSAKEKLTGFVSEIAGVSLAMAALKFAIGSIVADKSNAAKLSEEDGQRRKQLGQDAAILGLSPDDMRKVRDANGLTTVAENQEYIHAAAEQQRQKPFGVPRVGGKEVMEGLDKFQSTGDKRLVDVYGMPQAVPGNIGILSDMILGSDAGNPRDLKNAANNYSNKIPQFAKDEMMTQRDISLVDDASANAAYTRGVDDRKSQSGRRSIRNSGADGQAIAGGEDISDHVGFAKKNWDNDRNMFLTLLDAINDRIKRNQQNQKPVKVEVSGTPRPGRRDGDQ